MAIVQVLPGGLEYATDMNNALTKRVGSAKVVADSAAITTTITQIATVTVTLTVGMTYGVAWHGRVSSSVIGDIIRLRLHPTSVATAELTIQQLYIPIASGAAPGTNGYGLDVYGEYTALASGSFTFVASVVRSVGTGNIIAKGTALAPAFLTVDYLGI